ncbi:MAG: hypothetical protein LUE98_19895 [Tannerellaceae bacterium]|nr:hypothetical protein [Tannerellaceae bacterium]
MGSLDIRELPTQIIQIYKWFWEFFFGTTFMDNTWGYRCEINLIAFVIIILYIEVFLVTHLKNRLRILFTNVFLLLIPLALMSIVILAPEVSITGATGVLMLPSIVYVYIIPLTFKWEETVAVYPRIKKYLGTALTTGCILVCYSMIITESAGQTYIKHNMAKTESVAYALVDSVEELVDTSSNYKLCIVGNMEDGNYPELYSSLRSSQKWLTPYGKTVWTTYSGTQNSWKGYIQQFMGKTYNFCSESEYDSISTELIESMNNYPDEGSVEIIDDIILIKLSDASY